MKFKIKMNEMHLNNMNNELPTWGLSVTFSSSNKINERKNFSTKKIKNDINWEPKFTIQKGLQDYFNNIDNK